MSSALCKTSVVRIYQEVIDDVIGGVRELFLEDGVDETVLQDLKQAWETKLKSSKAVQNEAEEKLKKPELVASNGYPKVINQQPTQVLQQQHAAPVQSQITQLVETKQVPIQITLPPQPGTDGGQRVLTIQVPATALQGNQLQKVLTGPVITATMGLPAHIASSLLQQHVNAAFSSQQQAVAIVNKNIIQTDGAVDSDEGSIHSLPQSSGIQNEDILNYEDLYIEIIMPRKWKGCQKQIVQEKVCQTDGPMDTSDEDDDASDDDVDDDDLDDDKDDEDQEMEDEGGEEEPLNSEDDVTDDEPSDLLFETDNIVVCQYDKIIRNRNKWKFYLKDGIMNLSGQDYVFQKATGDAEW